MKRMLCLILSLALLLSLPSCAVIDRFKGDMSKIDYDDQGRLLYGENVYDPADDRFQVCTSADGDVIELGRHSQFPFFPDMHFYAFEDEAPLFIFCDNKQSTLYNKGLYVRSDYDLQDALFTVDGTDLSLPLSSAMTPSLIDASKVDSEGSATLRMYLKDDPRVQIELSGPFKQGDEWYLIRMGKAWLLTEEFISLLHENGIIDN